MTYEYPPDLREDLIEAGQQLRELRDRLFVIEARLNSLYAQFKKLQAQQLELLKKMEAMEDKILGWT